MYIHWSHFLIPKIFGGLSFICNPIFIYLIVTESKAAAIGKYRYLLLFFAVFDMTYSAVELVVPMAIHGSGAAFVVYIAEGPFFENLEYGQLALAIRCGFISLSYGILVIHFVYRYLVLFNPHVISILMKPWGMVFIFVFFVCHGMVWTGVCQLFLYGDDEVRTYVHDDFMATYGVDSHKLSMLIAMYHDGSSSISRRSWIGILILTGISSYAISLYFILGWKIVKKLGSHQAASSITIKLNKQLFKALVVQTVIPICISFAPCLVAWYTPAVGLDMGRWNNFVGVIALSAFPTLDPLAIIVLLPNYRNRLLRIFGKSRKNTYYVSSVTRMMTISASAPTITQVGSKLV